MREALLIAAVLIVPPLWGYAMYWLLARLWRPAAAPPVDRPAGAAPKANPPDYQI